MLLRDNCENRAGMSIQYAYDMSMTGKFPQLKIAFKIAFPCIEMAE